MNPPSLLHGRLCVVAAALLWSLSGAFAKLLRPPEAGLDGVLAIPGLVHLGLGDPRTLGLGDPPVAPLIMACGRGLFAGLAFIPFLRRRYISYRPIMLGMVLCFAVMNALFVSAMALGTAANAIFLQYTAPLWMYLAGRLWLKEPSNRRNTITLVIAMTGVAVIVGGPITGMLTHGGSPEELLTVLIALGSGITYAGVLMFIRHLRDVNSTWITVQNNLLAGLVLLPLIFVQPMPTGKQLICLALFGAVQMALPYWLMARGLKTVSAEEACTITLLEPLLNPIWAYLVAGDVPERWTLIGGGVILAALAWRYWPQSPKLERG